MAERVTSEGPQSTARPWIRKHKQDAANVIWELQLTRLYILLHELNSTLQKKNWGHEAAASMVISKMFIRQAKIICKKTVC